MADTYFAVMRDVCDRSGRRFSSAFEFPFPIQMPPLRSVRSIRDMAGLASGIEVQLRQEGYAKAFDCGVFHWSGVDVHGEVWMKKEGAT